MSKDENHYIIIIFLIIFFSNIEIRKNRQLIDYLEYLITPNMHKEYILITPNNFVLITPQEFDKIFDSLIINMPIKKKGKK